MYPLSLPARLVEAKPCSGDIRPLFNYYFRHLHGVSYLSMPLIKNPMLMEPQYSKLSTLEPRAPHARLRRSAIASPFDRQVVSIGSAVIEDEPKAP